MSVISEGIPLSYVRTVDRTLLHRSALSEVFLTDYRHQDPSRFLAAAQLPASHAYYTDHLSQSRVLDPLLLLECCRQAETYAGHAHFDIPHDQNFILKSWSMTYEPTPAPAPGTPPAELRIEVETANERRLRGQLRGVTYVMAMLLGAERIGEVRMDVGYLPSEVYRSLRHGRRPDAPALSDLLPPRPVDALADAAAVDRADRRNVVLGTVDLTGPLTGSALLLAPFDNPSMFDHRQDHMPGMVMMEAARQLGLYVMAAGAPAPAAVMTGFTADFFQYAELDRPTLVTARPARDTAGAETVLEISFEQESTVVASGEITLRAADGLPG
ncbi:ScbA/BarX family gamma-butyrolactone biosynthesis protein [Streptomyces sp. NPDC057705]|uniref:ScbA/BarX family gamma-butyrolactone biosynthesis protein n=1 Tax=Streptomyces sp. NPDC057705 TaxID=3346222 RepID=UPI0036941CFC